jgi:fructoselysine 6-kinase
VALTAIVLGDNCIDRYLPPVAAEFVGGQAVNVAAGLAAAGIPTAYAGVVGSDEAGRRIVAELTARAIDVSAVERRPGTTGLTVIATEGGDRRFVSEAYGVSAPYVPTATALRLVAGARLAYAAHVDDLRTIRTALVSGAVLALDASETDLSEVQMREVDILFVSRSGASRDDAMTLGQGLVRRGLQIAVVTVGASGAVAVERGGRSAACSAVGPVAVDTLGAGDALAAGFLASWLANGDIELALERGSLAAAAACAHEGALPA